MTRPAAGYADQLDPGDPRTCAQTDTLAEQHERNARRVAIALIGYEPTPDVARDVAQALGLIPTVPARPAARHGESGAERLRRLKAQAQAGAQ